MEIDYPVNFITEEGSATQEDYLTVRQLPMCLRREDQVEEMVSVWIIFEHFSHWLG